MPTVNKSQLKKIVAVRLKPADLTFLETVHANRTKAVEKCIDAKRVERGEAVRS